MRSCHPKVTVRELSERIGVTYHVLHNWINNRTPWPLDAIEKVRKALDQPVGWPFNVKVIEARADLVSESQIHAYAAVGLRPAMPTAMVYVPITGRFGAGEVPPDPADLKDPEAGVLVPVELVLGETTAMYAEGDSLLPLIQPGDKCVFQVSTRFRVNKLNAIRRGHDGTHPVVKEVRSTGGKLRLYSYNPSVPPMDLEEGDTALGVMTGFVSADGSMRIGPELGGISGEMIVRKLQERLEGWVG